MPWIPLLLGSAAAAPLDEVSASLDSLVSAPERAALVAHLDESAAALSARLNAVGPADPRRVAEILDEQVARNLAEKLALRDAGALTLDAARLRRTVLDYEAFKLETYVRSGVFPKRYFGYFDLEADTAADEWTLRETVRCATGVINPWLRSRGELLQVNDAEIAVTFIAEGGALLLRELQARKDHLHPVYDVGLDDVALGSAALPGLVEALDQTCGSSVATLITWTDPDAPAPPGATGWLNSAEGRRGWLTRDATFKEGIVGTAMMWVWEKELAARKLDAEGRTPLHARDRATQFVIGSLVYNSGLVHSESTIHALVGHQTGAYLFERSEVNAHRRPRLNLLAPPELLVELLEGGTYRSQETSWVGVYHVAQRYGGWEALRRFTDVFDAEGGFQPAAPVAPVAPALQARVESAPPPRAPAASPEPGCATVGGAAWRALLACFGAISLRRPARPRGSGGP